MISLHCSRMDGSGEFWRKGDVVCRFEGGGCPCGAVLLAGAWQGRNFHFGCQLARAHILGQIMAPTSPSRRRVFICS